MSGSYVHVGGQAPLFGDTIDGFFRKVAARFPERDAVVSIPQRVRRSYAELSDDVQRVAKALIALGVGRGDRVGIWSPDNVEWILVQMATARIGAVLVNVNPAYRVGELEHALRLARVQSLFIVPSFRSSSYVEMVCELCPELTRPGGLQEQRSAALAELGSVVVVDPDDLDAEPGAAGMISWHDFLAAGAAIGDADVSARSSTLEADDPINIQFTSGTTGFPKAVVLTHHNLVNNAYFAGEVMRFTEADRLCVPVPFYHCFGMVVSTLLCLTHGSAVVIPAPHFDAGATLAAIQEERCTAVHGVPTMFVAELERPDFDEYDLSSLRTGIMAGAPCPPELVRRVQKEMGCREILIGYGQTEASPITHLTRPEDSFERRVETVGTNLPFQETKVVDVDSGAVVPLGQQGEICFRGYHVMRGYFEQPEATRRAIDGAGWLHSGDLGVMDADGYVRITGRLKDMIIRGGENIYPAEIEAFYYEHPKVAEVAVFGVPDEKMGEEVGAWVRLHDGESADADELRDYAKGKIAHFKVPRYVWLVDEFPMTVTGKIQKFRIRELVAERLAKDAQRAG